MNSAEDNGIRCIQLNIKMLIYTTLLDIFSWIRAIYCKSLLYLNTTHKPNFIKFYDIRIYILINRIQT